MNKIIISKEQENALKSCLDLEGGSKERLLDSHDSDWRSEERKPLNTFSRLQLAEILINGYEVKETPLESLLNEYEVAEALCKIDGYALGFKNGVDKTLETFELNVKGIIK